jgi:hypothetical protein
MTSQQVKTHLLVASLKDGRQLYYRGEGEGKQFTAQKRWAWKMTRDEAEETTSRLHGVSARGHCWQEVSFFYPCKVSACPGTVKA